MEWYVLAECRLYTLLQEKLAKETQTLAATYLDKRASTATKLEFLGSDVIEQILAGVQKVQASSIPASDARVVFKARILLDAAIHQRSIGYTQLRIGG